MHYSSGGYKHVLFIPSVYGNWISVQALMKLARKMWAADDRINNAMTLILNKDWLRHLLGSPLYNSFKS